MTHVADYTPKVAVVTGAAQGIGRTIALRLAGDGFDIAAADLQSKQDKLDSLVKEVTVNGRKAVAVPTDVTKEEEVMKLIELTVLELGSVDVMVANAGIVKFHKLLETSTEDYDAVMNVNARGVMLCYKHAGLQMVKQKRGGRIIGASSSLGLRAVGSYLTTYTASKFAVRGLTQGLSIELAPHKVTVNCYCPGYINSDMSINPVLDATVLDGSPGSYLKWVCGAPPTAATADPDVVASFVSYLCKPEAHFITGQSIAMNAGGVMS